MNFTKREDLLMNYLKEVVKDKDFPRDSESVQIPICGYVVTDLFAALNKWRSESEATQGALDTSRVLRNHYKEKNMRLEEALAWIKKQIESNYEDDEMDNFLYRPGFLAELKEIFK